MIKETSPCQLTYFSIASFIQTNLISKGLYNVMRHKTFLFGEHKENVIKSIKLS